MEVKAAVNNQAGKVLEGAGVFGRVEPGVSYVAVCARVSAAGASAYSAPSEPAIAAAPVEREAPSRDVDDVAREPVQRVHPKIARARAIFGWTRCTGSRATSSTSRLGASRSTGAAAIAGSEGAE